MKCPDHDVRASLASRPSPARLLRAVACAASLAGLVACAGLPGNDPQARGEVLHNSLPIAAAALAAGQTDVARRLYHSLDERFDDAPEPALGLGYLAFLDRDFAAAKRNFLKAAGRASDTPATKAEALLGAGRAALAEGGTHEARVHLRNAWETGPRTPSAAWIVNGLAVTAALEADYETAEAHYTEALRLSSGHPRIAANLVRTLVAAGRIDDAARMHAEHPSSWWAGDDGPALSRLIEESRRVRARARLAAAGAERPDPASPRHRIHPNLALRLSAFDLPPVRPAGAGVPAAARSAPSDSSPLLLRLSEWPGPLTPPELNGVLTTAPSAPVPAPSSPPPVSSAPPASPASPASPVPRAPSPAAPSASPLAASSAAPEGARPPPEAESPETGPPAVAAPDHSPPTTLTLTLGHSRRLPLERGATAVLVASPEVADVQLLAPDVLYVIGKGIGRTSVAVLDDGEWIGEQIVSVVLDLEPLRTILASERGLGQVRARRLARGMALTGEVPSAAAADRALRLAAGALPEGVPIENELRIAAPQQVNLEVLIAEVHRSATESLGVNWEAVRTRGDVTFGFAIGRRFLDDSDPFTFIRGGVDGESAAGIGFRRDTGRTRISGMIDALATAGLANVLARPNLTAVSGETASFFSGGEYPLPTGFEDGVIIFEYKKFGVLLDFVPTVADTGRIVLTVRPEVSEPSESRAIEVVGTAIPVINVRRAETTVEVGDGESIVIAGLFRNESNTTESGVPGLKDLPLVGVLFGSTSVRSDELELIVVVTARLVRANPQPAAGRGPGAPTRQTSGYHH